MYVCHLPSSSLSICSDCCLPFFLKLVNGVLVGSSSNQEKKADLLLAYIATYVHACTLQTISFFHGHHK